MHDKSKCTLLEVSIVTDKALIDSTLGGNHAAYAELVARYQDRLYASMLSVVQSAELAEEVVHVAFVQAYLKLNTFRHHATFLTWLFRIAYNKFLSIKRKNRDVISLRCLENSRQREAVDPGDSPEKLCMRAENVKKLHDALARLDSRSREILVLREFNELTYEQISNTLEMKLGTVRSKLSRARCKLLNELSSECFDDC